MAESSRRAAPDDDQSQESMWNAITTISKEVADLAVDFRRFSVDARRDIQAFYSKPWGFSRIRVLQIVRECIMSPEISQKQEKWPRGFRFHARTILIQMTSSNRGWELMYMIDGDIIPKPTFVYHRKKRIKRIDG